MTWATRMAGEPTVVRYGCSGMYCTVGNVEVFNDMSVGLLNNAWFISLLLDL